MNEKYSEAEDLAYSLAEKLREIAKADPVQGVYLADHISNTHTLAQRMSAIRQVSTALVEEVRQ